MNDVDANAEDVDVNATGMTSTSVRQISQAPVTSLDGHPVAPPPEAILAPHEDPVVALEQLGVGTVVEGKYRIDAILGRGAMGVVVSATHLDLRETVALKFLNLRMNAKGDDFHLRFRREAQLCAKLRSEHVARVIDVGVWKERTPYMVMEHLVGMDLSQVLKARGPLPVNVALEYIVQVCQGLAEAHGLGVVHRDLKPSNLFVTQRHDGSELVKVLDFGISKWSVEDDISELTQSGVVLGSPKYMAAEQLFGSANVDARADVWSIGAIFYTMLAGKSPYDFPTITRLCAELATNNPPPSLRERRPEVPPALDLALMRCFARDREQRIQNVADLAGDLLDAVEAPFADAVRMKIMSSLDPKKAREQNSKSGPRSAVATGQYRALSATGSGGYAALPASLAASGSGAVLSIPRDDTGAMLAARKRRERKLLITSVAAAVVALGALSVVATSSSTTTSPAVAETARRSDTVGAAAQAQWGAPASLPASAASTLTSVDVTTPAPKPATTAVAAPAASPAVDRKPAAPSRPAVVSRPQAIVPAAPAKTLNTPPEVAATPTSAPSLEAPKKKGNPLEERQ